MRNPLLPFHSRTTGLTGLRPLHFCRELLPPPYSGRLIHRHVLGPSQAVTVQAKLWATRPGCYALDAWTVETEVGEPFPAAADGSTAAASAASPPPRWRSRGLRYVQGPRAGERPCVTIVDVGRRA